MLNKDDENKHEGSIRQLKTNYLRMKQAWENPAKEDKNAFGFL
jgi:hypothetical protein